MSIWSSLARLPEQAAFDLFILSDTRKLDIAAAEEAAWRELAARHHARGRIFYRRRAENTGRKAGNIADFVRAWGGAYDYAIVLDADSIMSGEALVKLARLMDAHPQAGIIQALPVAGGPGDVLRASHPVRRAAVEPHARKRPCLVAARGRQLLGPQRHSAPEAVRRLLRPAAPAAARRRSAARS